MQLRLGILYFCWWRLVVIECQQQPARTPPRGWNSYDCYSWVISEDEFLRNAQLVADKLLPYGYEYVVIDFLWYRKKEPGASVTAAGFDVIDTWGRPIPDPVRWPSSVGGNGLKSVADRVHAMGLKLGLHVMRGISTQAVKENTPILGTENFTWAARDIALQDQPCSWMPLCFVRINESLEGGKAFIQSLYNQYASWGVDFVKHDCVFGIDDLDIAEISAVSQAIVATGRAMVYSISPGVNANIPMAKLVSGLVNMYRVTSDDWDSWKDLHSHFDVARDFADAGLIGAYGLLGSSWVDLDMLPLGYLTDPGAAHGPYRFSQLTSDEQRTQITLWAMVKSPLMFGGDMLHIDNTTLKLLTNPTVLDINANSFGNKEVQVTDMRCLSVAALKRDAKLPFILNLKQSYVHEGWSRSESFELTPFSGWPDGYGRIRGKKTVIPGKDVRVWIAHGRENLHYMAIFNVGEDAALVSMQLENVFAWIHALECVVQDVWNGHGVEILKGSLTVMLVPHGCALYSLQCVLW